MAHSASIEWLGGRVGVLRLHPHPAGRVGDPYDWCCTVLAEVPGTATLKGVCKPLPAGGAAAVVACLLSEGFARRRYARRDRSGVRRTVEKRNRAESS